jgi:hypothetical protein
VKLNFLTCGIYRTGGVKDMTEQLSVFRIDDEILRNKWAEE